MSMLIVIPKLLFAILSLLFPQRKTAVEPNAYASFKHLPPKPTEEKVNRWMRYLCRRFPGLTWEWHCKGEFVYICINSRRRAYLLPVQKWLGGGTFAPCGLVYAVALS